MFFYSESEENNNELIIQGGSTDSYFDNVRLLLPMDSDFNDVSSNSYVPTVNGGAGIDPTEVKFGAGSGQFSGGNHISFAATPELAIGTQDFTLEMWINRNGSATSKFYIFNMGAHNPHSSYALYIQDGYLRSDIYNNGLTSSNIDTTPGQWHHIAVSRESGVMRLFVDGNLVGTNNNAGDSLGNYDIKVGGQVWGEYNDFVGGRIDDLRLTIGVARYTANFTPPTEAHPTQGGAPAVSTDPYFSNVSLLLNMDSDFSDSSTNGLTVNANGNVTIASTESKYGGASGYFDGSGDYLAINDLSAFDFGANEFTVECWINRTGYGPNTQWGDAVIMTTADPSDGRGFGIMDRGGNFAIVLSTETSSAWQQNVNTGVAVPQNEWAHVAFVRVADSIVLYLNGVNVWSTTISGALSNTDGGLRIGGRALWNQFFTGYIDDVRITKGVARYTANFTPPTEAHPTS